MLKQLLDTLYIIVLYAANYVEKWDTKKMTDLPQERCTEAAPFTYVVQICLDV